MTEKMQLQNQASVFTRSLSAGSLSLLAAVLLTACGGGGDPKGTHTEFQAGRAVLVADTPVAATTTPTPTTPIESDPAVCEPLKQRRFVADLLENKYALADSMLSLNPDTATGDGRLFFSTHTELADNDLFSFSTTKDAPIYRATQVTGYGFDVRRTGTNADASAVSATSDIYISVVYPGSSAAKSGLQRGDRLVSYNTFTEKDGVFTVNPTVVPLNPKTDNEIRTFVYATGGPQPAAAATGTGTGTGTDAASGAAASTTLSGAVLLNIERRVGNAKQTLSVRVVPSNFNLQHVPLVKTLTTSAGTVGYLLLNDFGADAETEAATKLATLPANLNAIVVDLRYNDEGFLDVASRIAYMIAGTRTANIDFARLKFNSKRVAENTTMPFFPKASSGTALPALNLTKVIFLTSLLSCGGSEALINGLKGLDGMQIFVVGNSESCGDPYGSLGPRTFCDSSYYPIEFTVRNAKDQQMVARKLVRPSSTTLFGSRTDCLARDDLLKPLGDPDEAMLSTGLNWVVRDNCRTTAPTDIAASAFLPGAIKPNNSTWGGMLVMRKVTD